MEKYLNTFAENIDKLLKDELSKINRDEQNNKNTEYIGSETAGEIIEKLLILNIRIWILEDLAAELKNKNNLEEYAKIKIILDKCFKIKRPQLVAALNKIFDEISSESSNFVDAGNIKIYKNEKNDGTKI